MKQMTYNVNNKTEHYYSYYSSFQLMFLILII